MSGEHYSRQTTAILKYCPTCGKNTMHKVSVAGCCLNDHAKPTKAQVYAEPEPTLF